MNGQGDVSLVIRCPWLFPHHRGQVPHSQNHRTSRWWIHRPHEVQPGSPGPPQALQPLYIGSKLLFARHTQTKAVDIFRAECFQNIYIFLKKHIEEIQTARRQVQTHTHTQKHTVQTEVGQLLVTGPPRHRSTDGVGNCFLLMSNLQAFNWLLLQPTSDLSAQMTTAPETKRDFPSGLAQ